MPFGNARDLFGDASLLGVNLPGHTASQLGLAFHAHELGDVFLVADACWKIEGLEKNCKPSRLAYTLFDSSAEYNQSFDKLCELHHSANCPLIIPSHCLSTWAQWGGTRRVSKNI